MGAYSSVLNAIGPGSVLLSVQILKELAKTSRSSDRLRANRQGLLRLFVEGNQAMAYGVAN